MEISTAYEDDVKTKNIEESLYILELLVKNKAQVSEKNIDTVRHVENLDLREKMRILLHLTREQVES